MRTQLSILMVFLHALTTRAENLTLSIAAPPANVTSVKLIDVRWAIGATVPVRITNVLALTTRTFTFTGLTYGTNIITIVWVNSFGSTESKPFSYVSIPDTSAPAQPPTPGHANRKKPPQPPQPIVASVIIP